jgi:hypothetical protein
MLFDFNSLSTPMLEQSPCSAATAPLRTITSLGSLIGSTKFIWSRDLDFNSYFYKDVITSRSECIGNDNSQY